MSEPLAIGYFLEDIAHERLLTSLVERMAERLGLAVLHDVRNASGGRGLVMTELRQYLLDVRAGRLATPQVLVVAIDGNCTSYQGRRREIEQVRDRARYQGTLVCAVPDPHIERWYLADPEALRAAVAGGQPPSLPQRKCERDLYKRALRQAFGGAGITPQLGGAEYAQDIVTQMDLSRAAQADRSLGHFLSDLRSALMSFAPHR